MIFRRSPLSCLNRGNQRRRAQAALGHLPDAKLRLTVRAPMIPDTTVVRCPGELSYCRRQEFLLCVFEQVNRPGGPLVKVTNNGPKVAMCRRLRQRVAAD